MRIHVYESSDGLIHAVVMDGDEIRTIVSGFEDENISRNEFIAAARSGFAQADGYDPANYSGMDMVQAARRMEDMDHLIAEITEDSLEMHPENMGLAGHILFEMGTFF